MTNEEVLKPRAELLLDRLDKPLLALAAISVAFYLAELQDFWLLAGLESFHRKASLAIDAVFLADLLLKATVIRRRYFRSPWIFIDLISTAPILSAIAGVPDYVEALRVLRGLRFFRVFRAMRVLRVLRAFRMLQFLKFMSDDVEESPLFRAALSAAVAVYALLFLGLMAHVQRVWPAETGTAQQIEFYMVLASILGMSTVLAVVRFQMPDIASHHLRLLLNIALPKQVAEHFLRHPEAYDVALCMPATIIFSDIRGFTKTVESLGNDLQTLKAHLERVLDTIVDMHVRHDLIVDKFIGDAVMSFRGGDLVPGTPREHALRVVKAALDSVKALRALNDPRFESIKIGGASAEQCLIGTFGTSKRLSYTVLGDAVNLAARLEPACGHVGAENLFCETTYRLLADHPELLWRRFGSLKVSGKEKVTQVYEAFDPSQSQDRGWLGDFDEGLRAYEARRVEDAKKAFAQADRRRAGGDAPSRYYLNLCDPLLRDGFPEGWMPVIELRK